jgi:hypothetical protein
MNDRTPREVGDIPPDRQAEEKAQGADPDAEDTNPERQGPNPAPEPVDQPKPGEGQESSEPPPESIPGEGGQVPNPSQ